MPRCPDYKPVATFKDKSALQKALRSAVRRALAELGSRDRPARKKAARK